jgi:hypothetical protein
MLPNPEMAGMVASVKLSPVAGSMDEVTVIGYGQQKKVSVVGSQATVNPEELKLLLCPT